ncbi:hypothetical protein DPMN_066225 [Dreissena polymorpha]|uniref:Uncharacterized protein n=1 Tax=Dreissena polymorpha TaxID=45954 RepID=A0A9D4BRW1_DREPO|nr:hypothetical protein DPMN_066225 [Dreissena polymorpha]
MSSTITNHIKDVLRLSAEEILGRMRRKTNQWVTSEIMDLCGKRSLESRADFQKANMDEEDERDQGGLD